MLFRATISQTKFLLKQKGAIFTFCILSLIMLFNFLRNVLDFQSMDVIEMYHPMKLLSLSYNRIYYNADISLLLVQLFPLLAVCPAGFSLAKDQQTGLEVAMTARLGTHYKLSKLLAAFFTTMIIFSVPFLLEIILNCISFPLNAEGDLSNRGKYDQSYIQGVHNYLWYALYVKAPYLYTVFGTLFFGAISGLLGVFTAAFSSIIRVKYKVFLFIPVFVLLNLTLYLPYFLPDMEISTKWYDYLFLFNDECKSSLLGAAAVSVLLIFSVCAVLLSCRKESLN